MEENTAMSHIKILPPHEARRIAAGEVIDRPAALIREFLDNAIDAGAANIEVSIDGGGSKKAELIDDGRGMSREDLELCWQTHATSKIRGLDDLATARTLGFRGEALAAAAAVAKLEITSSPDSREAWQLEAGPGDSPPLLSRNRRTKGSTVRALGLFDTIPARRQFLKRDGSEALLCHQAFIDKALAFPGITFRFTQDGKAKNYLPKAASKKERFSAALLRHGEENFLHEIHTQGTGFTVDLIIGGPELARNDKRMLFIFANGRRVQDYALVQALVFGAQGWFPNGTMPIGAAFIDIDPALADFNIHPAKREVRFADPSSIHHTITTALENFRRRTELSSIQGRETDRKEKPKTVFFDTNNADNTNNLYYKIPSEKNEWGTVHEKTENLALNALTGMRCLGRLFDLFILIEYEDRLFIIDQHAAHERILYNKFIKGTIARQELLVTIPFTTESADDDSFLRTHQKNLENLGITVEEDKDGWRIGALPVGWRLSDAETIKEILSLKNTGNNMAEHWAASLSCKRAVKDGDYLDNDTAMALAKEALNLPEPRCPHGRPIWLEIRREQILKAVRRL